MRFSFYNTIEKSQFFLKKFKEDNFLEQRKTNNYQNMFKRTITAENIMNIVKQSKEKYKIGSWLPLSYIWMLPVNVGL